MTPARGRRGSPRKKQNPEFAAQTVAAAAQVESQPDATADAVARKVGGNMGRRAGQGRNRFRGKNAPASSERPHARTAEVLLSRAAFAAQRGNHKKALALFEEVAQSRPQDIELQFQIAQELTKLDRAEEAADVCRQILERDSGHERAAQLLEKITPSTRAHRGSKSSAGLGKASALNHEQAIRQIRKLRKQGQTRTAEERCREILGVQPDHPDASAELALLLRIRDDYEGALAQLEIARAANPGAMELLLQSAQTLRSLRRYDEARNLFQDVLEREPGNEDALHGLARLAQRVGEWSEALVSLEALAEVKPDDAAVLIDIATAQFEMIRYEEAEATLRRADELAGTYADDRHIARKFQYFCVTAQWERAQECLDRWPDHRAVPRSALADVVRFYAERGRWNEVIDFVRERVVEGRNGARNGETLLSAISSAVRHTGRYSEALEILDRWPGEDSTAVQNLREQIAEEVALLDAVGLRDLQVPDQTPGIITNNIRTERNTLLRRALSGKAPVPILTELQAAETVYFCADAKYVLGAAVSFFSLLRHNPDLARNCAFLLYCPPGLLDFASVTFAEIAASKQADIIVRSSATLLRDDLEFRTKWGAFTLGRGLSIAAYYRIFAALQMLHEKRSGRALYIDSDTCVGPGLEGLLRFDMNGQPLGVRREEPDGPGVMRACARLGITRGEYFNSGVLLLDLTHPGLEAALDRSVSVALNKQHLLTMVDQCALNVGFEKLAASLPPEFNFFVRDDEHIEIPVQTPVVTHYTAHPKPWDTSYQSRHCLLWFREFEALGAVLAPERMKQLFAYSFPQRHGAWTGAPSGVDMPSSLERNLRKERTGERALPAAAAG